MFWPTIQGCWHMDCESRCIRARWCKAVVKQSCSVHISWEAPSKRPTNKLLSFTFRPIQDPRGRWWYPPPSLGKRLPDASRHVLSSARCFSPIQLTVENSHPPHGASKMVQQAHATKPDSQPEFHPRSPCGRRKEPTSQSYPLTSCLHMLGLATEPTFSPPPHITVLSTFVERWNKDMLS